MNTVLQREDRQVRVNTGLLRKHTGQRQAWTFTDRDQTGHKCKELTERDHTDRSGVHGCSQTEMSDKTGLGPTSLQRETRQVRSAWS